jgi:hypothetical protein
VEAKAGIILEDQFPRQALNVTDRNVEDKVQYGVEQPQSSTPTYKGFARRKLCVLSGIKYIHFSL